MPKPCPYKGFTHTLSFHHSQQTWHSQVCYRIIACVTRTLIIVNTFNTDLDYRPLICSRKCLYADFPHKNKTKKQAGFLFQTTKPCQLCSGKPVDCAGGHVHPAAWNNSAMPSQCQVTCTLELLTVVALLFCMTSLMVVVLPPFYGNWTVRLWWSSLIQGDHVLIVCFIPMLWTTNIFDIVQIVDHGIGIPVHLFGHTLKCSNLVKTCPHLSR